MVTFADGGDLGATAFVQLTPNDSEKIIYVRNTLAGSRSIILFQGTYNASNDYEVPAGTTAVVYFDGAGSGAVAANVFNNAYFDSLRLGGVSVTAIIDDDTMGTATATNIATSESIKAYVDSQVTAQDLDFGGDSGTGAVDLDSQSLTIAGTSNEIETSASGQTLTIGLPDDVTIAGDLTVDTDTLYVDSTNNRVGIGTSSPETNLQIEDSSSFSIIRLVSSTTDDAGIDFGDPDDRDIGRVRYDNSDNSMVFTTNAAEAIRIDSSGRVGIGTSSPSADLELGGTGEVLRLSGSSTNAYIRNTDGTTNQWYIGSGGNAGLQHYIYQAQPMTFHTNGTERMRIDASGNVGIGTSSPTNGKLEVTHASSTVPAGFFRNTSGSGDSPSLTVQGGANNAAPNFSVLDYNGTTDFVVQGAGNVGIGTSSPSDKLHVQSSGDTKLKVETTGTTAASGHSGLALNTGNGGYLLQNLTTADSTHGVLRIYDTANSAERMRISSSGNVGIGTSSPEAELHIAKSNSGGRGGTLVIENSHSSILNNEVQITFLTDSGASLAGTSNARIKAINTNAGNGAAALTFTTWSGSAEGERMRISSSGNVGIGDLGDAATLLHIGSTGTPEFRVQDLDAGGGYLSVTHNAGTSTISADPSNSSGSPTLVFKTVNSEAMRIDSSGRLMVGTSTVALYSSTSGGETGTVMTGNGDIYNANDGATNLILNRLTSNGNVLDFRKNGSTVGSVATKSRNSLVRPYIGNSNTRLLFDNTVDSIIPVNNDGDDRNAAISLGEAGAAFKDLYLTGGIQFDSRSSKLDDYEEGTFNPTIGFRVSATGSLSYTRRTFRYIKVGSSVFITGFLTWYENNFTANSGAMQLQGLPFAFANSQDFRGGVNVVYSDANFTGVTIYQQGFRNEQAEANMVFNFSDTTDGAMDSTITSYTSIPSGGSMMISGVYTTT
jgi:hypothetical protein